MKNTCTSVVALTIPTDLPALIMMVLDTGFG